MRLHGLTITETAKGPRAVRTQSMAVIGIIATSAPTGGEDAAGIDAAYPLNTPVLVTDVEVGAGKAGSGGTLKRALEAIGDQTSPLVIVVRIAEGANAAETAENAIGSTDGNSYTGIQALLVAENVVGLRPRIIGAPGLDGLLVTQELVAAAKKLRAMVYAGVPADDLAEALLYRANFSDRELMLIWPDSSAEFPGDIVARALGLRARIDEEQGWHKTISNVPLGGVAGITRDVHFDLLDPSTEAGALNDKDITTLIRQNGYRLWGNRTAADPATQPEFSFESAVRTSHALQDILAAAVAPFLDQPMTIALIKDLLESANAEFRQLVIAGRIVGAEAFFDAGSNTPEQLAAGRPTFRIQYTPTAPLENPRVELVITDYYYTGFADLLV